MRARAVLALACLAACAGPRILHVTPATLARQLARPLPDGSVLRLAPGDYWLEPEPYTERTAGASRDPPVERSATVGWRISGREIQITGAGAGRTVLHTGAAYGLLFEDALRCRLADLTVTGGVRLPDPGLPCAAIVVKGDSDVLVERCSIQDNLGDPDVVRQTVSGIMGVNVRDGGRAVLRRNRILRNSWDGVAVYWDATAIIEDNLIDGVDHAGGEPGGGRGVGIGITLNPRVEVRGNRVTRYWKGIGLFVSPTAVVEQNVVEDVLTWGLSVWNAGDGAPRAVVQHNLVSGAGACGAAITLADPSSAGAFRGNLLHRSGQSEAYDDPQRYCEQCALALHGLVDGFVVEDNLAFDTREAGGAPGRDDVSEEVFLGRLAELQRRMARWEAASGAQAFATLLPER